MSGLRSRSANAIAIAVLLLAQLATSIHRADVQHVRCAHGELVHAPAVAKHSTDTASQLVGVELGTENGHDEHCVTATGVAGTQVSAPTLTVTKQGTEHAAVVASPRVVVQTTLYRTAPKTSPPTNA